MIVVNDETLDLIKQDIDLEYSNKTSEFKNE